MKLDMIVVNTCTFAYLLKILNGSRDLTAVLQQSGMLLQ